MWLDTIMTMDEVCEFLRVHKSTVYRMLKRGLMPAFKVGSDWRFSRARLDEWRLGKAGGKGNG